MRVAVVGAGAFGGWTALHLLRAGCDVTLIDAWGAANSRSSSGDETRVIRGAYGPNAMYTRMVARSVPMWRDLEAAAGQTLLHSVGSLWMAPEGGDEWERASLENIRAAGMSVEVLRRDGLERLHPGVNWSGIAWALFEPDLGYLMARRACQAVVRMFEREGGRYLIQTEVPPADAAVCACGPWLGAMIPDVLGALITATRQEVFYFGDAPGRAPFPAWVDNTAPRHYGIAGNEGRGFKAARDVPGPEWDPTAGDRTPSAEPLADARAYVAFRFPRLADAPLLESRVCQYEMSADGHLILDRHPGGGPVWFAGGGSGHSFKIAPAVGEHMMELVLGKRQPDPAFALARFGSGPVERRWERK